MGQNNDPTERGDLQGQQGGQLSRDPEIEKRERQKPEYTRTGKGAPGAEPLGTSTRP